MNVDRGTDPGASRSTFQAAHAASPPQNRRRALVVIVVALIAIVVVGGFLLFRDRLNYDVLSLVPGDCFDQPPRGNDTRDVQRRQCNEPHDAEVIGKMSHPAEPEAPYPTTVELRTFVNSACASAYASYTGSTYSLELGMDFGLFYPLEENWSRGDRDVTCYISLIDGSKLTAPLRNTGASAAPTS